MGLARELTEKETPEAIAVDFDGVVHAYSDGFRDGEIYDDPVPGAFKGLSLLMAGGRPVFIMTARQDLDNVVKWIKERAPELNPTLVPDDATFWDTPGVLGVTNRKLPAARYLDDKADRFTSWGDVHLGESYQRSHPGWWLDPAGEMQPVKDETHVTWAARHLGLPERPGDDDTGMHQRMFDKGWRRVIEYHSSLQDRVYVEGGALSRRQRQALEYFCAERLCDLWLDNRKIWSPEVMAESDGSRYQYYNNCVGWDMADVNCEGGLGDMINSATQISRRAFLSKVDPEQMAELERDLGYGPHLRMKNDWHVGYYRSELHGQPVVFFKWSAIEYVFVPRNFKAVSESRRLVELQMNPTVRLPARDVHFRARHGGPPPETPEEDDDDDSNVRFMVRATNRDGTQSWVIRTFDNLAEAKDEANHFAQQRKWRAYEVQSYKPGVDGSAQVVFSWTRQDEAARCQCRISKHSTQKCSRPATITRGGIGYCSRHDPEKAHSAIPMDGRRRFRWMAESIVEAINGTPSGLYNVPVDPSAEMRQWEESMSSEDFIERRDGQLREIVGEFKAKLIKAARGKKPEETGDQGDESIEAEVDRILRKPSKGQMNLRLTGMPKAKVEKPDPSAPPPEEVTNLVDGSELGIISWPRIPTEPLSRIWLVYGKRGTIFDEDGLDRIVEQIKTLITRFYASTEMSGHTEQGAEEEMDDAFGRPMTEHERDLILGMLNDEKGNCLLSDYAWKWLHPLYDKLCQAETAEEKLLAVDKILNVVHQRSDLAGVFVQGGTDTLRKIADQGGHRTPTEENPQVRGAKELAPRDAAARQSPVDAWKYRRQGD